MYAVTFTPDGRTLISAGRDRTVRFWERSTGRERRRLNVAAKGQVYSVSLAANGKVLATGSESHVALWDADTGKELHRMSVLPALSRPVALSPDGSTLASGSADRAVYLWKVATGEVLGKLTGHGGTITAVAFSPDGKTLASAGEDRLVCLWDVRAGTRLHTLRHASVISQILFTPDNKKLIAAGDDDLRVWTTTGAELRSFPTRGEIALSRDGAVLAVAGTFLALFDVASGNEIRRTSWQDWPLVAVAFAPDGKSLASGGYDSRIRIWDTATLTPHVEAPGHGSAVTALAFFPDGGSLISASDRSDLTWRIWDAHAGREKQHFRSPVGRISALAVSPDGKHVALGGMDLAVHLVKAAAAEEVQRFEGHARGVTSLAFSPDGRKLASGGADGAVRLWDLGSNLAPYKLNGHFGNVTSVAFSPDSKTLASTGAALGPVRLWDVNAGRELRHFGAPGKMYHSVVFTPDGRYLAASEWPGVTLWEVATGKVFQRFSGPRAGLQISRDGRTLWANDGDESLCLWEIATGALRVRLSGHGAPILALALSPDGRRLASGSSDTTVLLWDAGRTHAMRSAVLTQGQLGACWKDLLADGESGQRAILTLAADPARAAPFLGDHIISTPPELVSRLIADLDNERFSVREKATRELHGLGRSVEKALQTALLKARSLEHRRRLEQLLERASRQILSKQQVRTVRAIEALEMMNSSAARQVLEGLARAATGTVEQSEAEASLGRMGQNTKR